MLPKITVWRALMTAAALGSTVKGQPLQTYVVKSSSTGVVAEPKPSSRGLPRQQPQSNSSTEMPDTADYAKLTGGFEKWQIAIPILAIIPGSVLATMIVYCVLPRCCQEHFQKPRELVKHVRDVHRKQLTLPQDGGHSTQVATSPANVNPNVIVTLNDLPNVGPTISI